MDSRLRWNDEALTASRFRYRFTNGYWQCTAPPQSSKDSSGCSCKRSYRLAEWAVRLGEEWSSTHTTSSERRNTTTARRTSRLAGQATNNGGYGSRWAYWWTWRGSNHIRSLIIRNLLILQNGRNDRTGQIASLRYTAGTRMLRRCSSQFRSMDRKRTDGRRHCTPRRGPVCPVMRNSPSLRSRRSRPATDSRNAGPGAEPNSCVSTGRGKLHGEENSYTCGAIYGTMPYSASSSRGHGQGPSARREVSVAL